MSREISRKSSQLEGPMRTNIYCALLFTVSLIGHAAVVNRPSTLVTKARFTIDFRWKGDGAFALQSGLAKPVRMVAADFNGDGIRDVAVLYQYAGHGVLARFLGKSGGLFETMADVVLLPTRADFIVAGDFDGDGLADVAVATAGSANIQYLSSKGNDGFAAPINM